jgi:hypothetical protein
MFYAFFLMAAGIGLYKVAFHVKENPGPVIELRKAIKNLLRK